MEMMWHILPLRGNFFAHNHSKFFVDRVEFNGYIILKFLYFCFFLSPAKRQGLSGRLTYTNFLKYYVLMVGADRQRRLNIRLEFEYSSSCQSYLHLRSNAARIRNQIILQWIYYQILALFYSTEQQKKKKIVNYSGQTLE